METVYAISLWEPWAILVPLGEKEYETRSWKPPQQMVGSVFVIHAAKRWTSYERGCAYDEFIHTALKMRGYSPDHLPLGAALGTVRLKAWFRSEDMNGRITVKERSFGNYQPERFAWQFTEPRLFAKPIPYRGQQGIWRWDLPLPEAADAPASMGE